MTAMTPEERILADPLVPRPVKLRLRIRRFVRGTILNLWFMLVTLGLVVVAAVIYFGTAFGIIAIYE